MYDLRWRDIETVPQDGTKILLGWFSVPNQDTQTIGFWDPQRAVWVIGNQVYRGENPTHWMPRPKPPVPRGNVNGSVFYLVSRDVELRESLLRPLDTREKRVTSLQTLRGATNRDVLVVFPGWERFFDCESRFEIMRQILAFPGNTWMAFEWF